MREERNASSILVGKPEGKRPLGTPRSSWVDNIKMDLREIGWGGMDWIDLTQERDHKRATQRKDENHSLVKLKTNIHRSIFKHHALPCSQLST
jgi:hypothetical protein